LTLQQTLPILHVANRFGPGGLAGAGYAPLGQPFVNNPNEYTLYGGPQLAYQMNYVAPSYGYGQLPLAAMPPAGPPPAPNGYAGNGGNGGNGGNSADPNGQSPFATMPPAATNAYGDSAPAPGSATALVQQMLRDGTLDQLTPSERATVVTQMATLEQTAARNLVEMRRVPYDLAALFQQSSRGWRDSYTLYASVVQGLFQNTCAATNPLPPTPAGAQTPAPPAPSPGTLLLNGQTVDVTQLAQLCRSGALTLPVCSGFR